MSPLVQARQLKTLYDADRIARRNAELAGAIAALSPRDLLVVPVLKGSFMFAADLLRALHGSGLTPEVDFIFLSSYRAGTASSGRVEMLRDIESAVSGRDVLLIDDILESGRTLAFAKALIAGRGAKRVLTCVLLDKPGRRAVDIEADLVGFECPDLFVVGYGMDMANAYRELPYVGYLDAGAPAPAGGDAGGNGEG